MSVVPAHRRVTLNGGCLEGCVLSEWRLFSMLFSIPDDISYKACGFVCSHSTLVKNLLVSNLVTEVNRTASVRWGWDGSGAKSGPLLCLSISPTERDKRETNKQNKTKASKEMWHFRPQKGSHLGVFCTNSANRKGWNLKCCWQVCKPIEGMGHTTFLRRSVLPFFSAHKLRSMKELIKSREKGKAKVRKEWRNGHLFTVVVLVTSI